MVENSKYDFDLDMVNTNSLSLVINQIKRGSTVLEFGPANGRMTRYLKEVLDCKVYLVEIDEQAGREALQYGCDLVADDIENYSWCEKYENISFDYITFADVLEHLRNPEEVVIRSKRLLKQDGSIIFSVPNIAHNSVLISLLNHEFEYTKVGLLDNTHIHFFTKNSIDNMVNRAGLTVAKRFATYAPAGTTEIPVHNEDVPGIDTSFWKTRKYGEVYQFVYEVKKGPEFIETVEDYLSGGQGNYYARIYLDRGNGYSNDDVISKAIRDVTGMITVEAVIPEDVKNIRFVPFDDLCFMGLVSATDLVDGEERTIRVVSSNETVKHEEQYMFSLQPPFFDYVPVVSQKKFHIVKFEYRLITIDKLAIEKLHGVWDEAYRLREQYKADISAFASEKRAIYEENERLEEVARALTGQVAHLDNLLKEVYNTFVWRMAERFRRFRNKFKKR